MAYEVRWTENAVEDIERIIDYLQREWSPQSAEKFVEKLFYKIEIVKALPHIGQRSEKSPDVRRVLVTKHNSIFYTYEENVITILNIFEHRLDPSKSIFD